MRKPWRCSTADEAKVEALQNAMVAILKSQQLRDVLVYATLLLVFATACVTYRRPDLAVPAIAIAGILLSAEAVLIYLAVKRLRRRSQ
jgi:multisubunit Na+/H+ antiporter MnhB subunit